MTRIAVVTPYYREERPVLERCIASVRSQVHPCTHILVADGYPQDLPEGQDMLHVRLPFNVGNSGATPRGVGAQIAFDLGFDVVAFLDADNWYETHHVSAAVAAFNATSADLVVARRQIIFPDGDVLAMQDPQDASRSHMDTNCAVLSSRVTWLASIWLGWPRSFGTGEDRALHAMVRQFRLASAYLSSPTVWYYTNWGIHYRLAGKPLPDNVRKPPRGFLRHFDAPTLFQATGIHLNPGFRGPLADEPFAPETKTFGRWAMVLVVSDKIGLEQSLPALSGAGPANSLVVLPMDSKTKVPEGYRVLRLPETPNWATSAAGIGALLCLQAGADRVAVVDAGRPCAEGLLGRVADAYPENGREPVLLASPEMGEQAIPMVVIPSRHLHAAILLAQLPALSAEDAVRVWCTILTERGTPLSSIGISGRKHGLPLRGFPDQLDVATLKQRVIYPALNVPTGL